MIMIKMLLKNTIVGEDNYCRITVPPMIWFGFKGLSSKLVIYLIYLMNLMIH